MNLASDSGLYQRSTCLLRTTAIFAICLCGLLAVGRAQESDVELRVRHWIRQLDSSDRNERMTAELSLRKMGWQVVSPLKSAMETSSSGMRRTLQNLQRQIELDEAKQALMGRKLTWQGRTLGEAITSINRQSGTKIALSAELSPALELLLTGEQEGSFWNALSIICGASGTDWKWIPTADGELQIELIPREGVISPLGQPHADVNCFRVSVRQVRREGAKTIRWHFRIDTERPVLPLYAIVEDAQIRILDGERALMPLNPDARREIAFQGQSAEFSIDFLPDGGADFQPVSVSGTFRIRCEVLPQPLSFRTDALQTQIQFSGNNEVRVLPVERDESRLRAQVVVKFPPEIRWESHQLDHLHQDAVLQEEGNRGIPFLSRKLRSETAPMHMIEYEFPVPTRAEAGMLIYTLPVLDTTESISFEISLDDG